MKYTDIIAVVVSYNGFHDIEKTINALLYKVGHIHVVDNGSKPESLDILGVFEKYTDVSITYLEDNFGIGKALNIGVDVAGKMGYKWLLTMDQDSVISETMIQSYCNAVNHNSNMVCLSPTINVFGKDLVFNRGKTELAVASIKYAITSGNLIKMELFDHIGTYDEMLFIDCVDFDFSLRLRDFGYEIHHIKSAVIFHQLGDKHSVPKLFAWIYTSHSPLRRYYMYRNWCYMIERYFRIYPFFIIKSTLLHLLLLLIIPVYDKHPITSLKYIYYGIKDYFNKQSGSINIMR